MIHQIGGLKVVSSPLATQLCWKVQRHPIHKRRRGWNVVKVAEPACWQMGGTLVMHPALIARLREKEGGAT